MAQARYHLLAAATSAVTLGVGVVVGVGPLSEAQTTRHERQVHRLTDGRDALAKRLADTRATAAGDAALARSLSRSLSAGRLDGRAVLVVAAPGAPVDDVRRVVGDVRRAGATVTGTLTLAPTYVDPAKAQSPLEDLSLRLVPPDVEFADGATPIERVGTVLARSTVTAASPAPAGIDQKAAALLAGLDELGAVTFRGGDPGRLAELAVVVAGPAPGRGDRADGYHDAMLGLVTALRRAGRGVVVSGDAAALRPGGLVAALRGAAGEQRPPVSTVDDGGSYGGDLATVLALAEQAAGDVGDYGTAPGADALLPSSVSSVDGDAAGG